MNIRKFWLCISRSWALGLVLAGALLAGCTRPKDSVVDAGGVVERPSVVSKNGSTVAAASASALAEPPALGTLPATGTCVHVTTGSSGPTQGEGLGRDGGGGCNQTEMAFFRHSQDCLNCMLNASGLHDVQGDPGPDCDDLAGTVRGVVGKGTSNVSNCLAVLECGISTGCFGGNVADCFCGVHASSTQCDQGPGDTTATGPCKTQEEQALGSNDPLYVTKHITDVSAQNNTTVAPNGGAVANNLLLAAHYNCAHRCF